VDAQPGQVARVRARFDDRKSTHAFYWRNREHEGVMAANVEAA
jgi:hypothetical protein